MAYYDKCVYTIMHSDKLNLIIDSNGACSFIEKKNWKTAQVYFEEAKNNNQELLCIFAPAETTNVIYSYAVIDNIYIENRNKTIVTIRNMTKIFSLIKKTEILKISGDAINEHYIRPYLLCLTKSIISKINMQIKDDDGVGFGIEEIIETNGYLEGKYTTSIVNRYERDPNARRACIEIYGTKCQICGFDFEEKYGDYGKGFIHIHHKTQLSELKETITNPQIDLIPVCPNCHAMIHKNNNKPLSIEELRKIIKT